MKCLICQGDRIELSDVNEEITLDNNIVYIPIKVSLCKTCGERYYDRRTMEFLEEVEKKIRLEQVKLKEIGKVLVYE